MKMLIEKIQSLVGKAQFVSLTYTTKTKVNKAGQIVDGGEIARFNAILGANYHRTVEQSLLAAQLLTDADLTEIGKAKDFELPLMQSARGEVISSLEKTLEAHSRGEQNSDYTKKHVYVPLGNGVNLNTNDNTLQLFVLVQSKVVLKPGVHKPVNSAPETIAKNIIRKTLPIGKFREFALDLGNIHGARLDGETLVIENSPLDQAKVDYEKVNEKIQSQSFAVAAK